MGMGFAKLRPFPDLIHLAGNCRLADSQGCSEFIISYAHLSRSAGRRPMSLRLALWLCYIHVFPKKMGWALKGLRSFCSANLFFRVQEHHSTSVESIMRGVRPRRTPVRRHTPSVQQHDSNLASRLRCGSGVNVHMEIAN